MAETSHAPSPHAVAEPPASLAGEARREPAGLPTGLPAELPSEQAAGPAGGWRARLLWIDGVGAFVAGLGLLIFAGWLGELYRLPRDLVLLIALVNLAYSSYSLSLATRARRSRRMITLLALANLAWPFLCFRWAYLYSDQTSVWGLAHLVGEGLWVGALGLLEWRSRDLLTRP